jgi:hypothetical protein
MSKSFPNIEVGAQVIGTHILGKTYSGKISSFRGHTLNPDLIEFFIELNSPTDFATMPTFKDIRTSLNVTASLEKSSPYAGLWVGPSGDHFLIKS